MRAADRCGLMVLRRHLAMAGGGGGGLIHGWFFLVRWGQPGRNHCDAFARKKKSPASWVLRGHGCLQAGPAMGLLGGLLGLKTVFVRGWLGG